MESSLLVEPQSLLPLESTQLKYVLKKRFNFFISEKNKEQMLQPEVVARIKYETGKAFRLDESKRPKDDVPLQTFRKLNVD